MAELDPPLYSDEQAEEFWILQWANGWEVYRTKEAAQHRKASLWDRGPGQIRYASILVLWPRWYIEERGGKIPE